MTVERKIKLDDLTPAEMVELFCDMDSLGQAEFFEGIWLHARAWSGAGWCQQSNWIVSGLSRYGQQTIETIADHLASHTGWRPSEDKPTEAETDSVGMEARQSRNEQKPISKTEEKT